MSWRNDASEQSQADLDGLLDVTLRFAQEALAERGAVVPFGAAVNLSGDTRLLAVEIASNVGQNVVDDLADAFRSTSATDRAVAIVADVRTSGGDAIRVELEHRDGRAITVLLPYRRRRLGRKVELGELSAGPGERRIWSDWAGSSRSA